MKKHIICKLLSLIFVLCLIFTACEGQYIDVIVDNRGIQEAGDQIVNLFNLTALLPAPVFLGMPVRAFENAQYNGTVEWAYSYLDGNEQPVIDPITIGTAFIQDEKNIVATVTLDAKSGFTFTGIPGDIFSHDSMLSITNLPNSGVVLITFSGLVAVETITGLDLSSFVSAPVHWHQLPAAVPIDTEEYSGTIEWFTIIEVEDGEDEHGVPILVWEKTEITAGTKINFYDNNFLAEVTLAVKEGYTFTGIGKDSFIHDSADSIENDADSGLVSLFFNGKNVVYPDLSRGVRIYNCCGYRIQDWWDNWSASAMLEPLNTSSKSAWSTWFGERWGNNFWTTPVSAIGNVYDSGPHRPINMAPNAEWGNFFEDSITVEHVKSGHANKFEDASVPEAIRKPAHTFTLDLGMELELTTLEFYPNHFDNGNDWEIERWGFGPYAGARDGWPGWWGIGGAKQLFPIEFEIFYSSDVLIGPVPDLTDSRIKTLGLMKFKPFHDPAGGVGGVFPGNEDFPADEELEGPNWRSVNLSELMDDGVFKARYIHIRFYRNGYSDPWGWYGEENRTNVAFSIKSLRIGMSESF